MIQWFNASSISASFHSVKHQGNTCCSFVKLFLKQQDWKLGNVQNGNCPFQALSFDVHQHQDMHNKQLIKNSKQQFKPFIIGSILIARHQHVKIRYMGNTIKAYSHFKPFSSSVYAAGKTTNYYTDCWRKYSPIVGFWQVTHWTFPLEWMPRWMLFWSCGIRIPKQRNNIFP